MKTYTKEFKLTLVKLAESGHPTKGLAKEYGVSKSTINTWRRAFKSHGEESFVGGGASPASDEARRIRELEKQLREVTMERDILKKVAAGDLSASSP